MLKLAPTAMQLPAPSTFAPLDIDGTNLPSDWYLRLAGVATRILRGGFSGYAGETDQSFAGRCD